MHAVPRSSRLLRSQTAPNCRSNLGVEVFARRDNGRKEIPGARDQNSGKMGTATSLNAMGCLRQTATAHCTRPVLPFQLWAGPDGNTENGKKTSFSIMGSGGVNLWALLDFSDTVRSLDQKPAEICY